MAVCQKQTSVEKKNVFASSHRHLCRHTIHIFLTASVTLIVMPCVPRTFSIPSFLSHSKLTSQLVLARHQAGRMFCGGKAVAGLCLLFVRALCLASSPRNPRTLARARKVSPFIADKKVHQSQRE